MNSRENKIKIIDNKGANRLDVARFSVSYNAPNDLEAARELAYDLIIALASGNDAIMEIYTSFSIGYAKNMVNEAYMLGYVESFKRLDISYKNKKVPLQDNSLFGKLFSIKSREDGSEITAYIDNNMLLSEDFRKILPLCGVRFYFAKRGAFLRGSNDRRQSSEIQRHGNDKQQNEDEPQLNGNKSQQNESETKLNGNGSHQDGNGSHQDGNGSQQNENEAQLNENKSRQYDNEARYNAINAFLDLSESEKLSLIEMSVFSLAHLGRIGISTEKYNYTALKDILNNE